MTESRLTDKLRSTRSLSAISGGCAVERFPPPSRNHLIKNSLPGQTSFLECGVGRTRLLPLGPSKLPDGPGEGAAKGFICTDSDREGVSKRLLHTGRITQ